MPPKYRFKTTSQTEYKAKNFRRLGKRLYRLTSYIVERPEIQSCKDYEDYAKALGKEQEAVK